MKNEKRKLILKVAEELFIKNGYVETKVEDITKKAGISKGNFYTYFKTKEDILLEIMNVKLSKYWEVIEKININNDPKQVLKDFFIKTLEHAIKNFPKVSSKNMDEIFSNEKIRNVAEEKEKEEANFLANNVVSRVNPNLDPKFISKFINNTISWYRFDEINCGRIGDYETYFERKQDELEEIINFIYNGLKG